MLTYLLHGFYRQDHSKKARMLVDSDNDTTTSSLFSKAEKITDNSIGFIIGQVLLDVVIADDCKGVVFNSEEEMYARVPQLRAITIPPVMAGVTAKGFSAYERVKERSKYIND